MKKDEQLEREFNAYFDGISPPDNATDRAKKLIEKKARTQTFVRRFVPAFAAVAAACGVIVFVANIGSIGDAAPPSTSNSTPASREFTYYTADTLNASALNVYSTTLPKGLEFVKKLEFAKNAAINDITAYTAADGSVSLVRADISATMNGYRHDTTVYAEYTPDRTVFEPLKAFYDGAELRYGATTLISYAESDGEPVCNLLVYKNGVRYYISVTSSDEYAYHNYLAMI